MRKRRSIPTPLAGALVAVCALATACTSVQDAATVDDVPPWEEAQTPGEIDPQGADLGVDEDTPYGEILVDANGYTLYYFEDDSTNPPESACEDNCAATWPPLQVNGDVSTDDRVNGALVGQLERPDGITQVTFAGWPLYIYVGDAAPGVYLGDAQGNPPSWFPITPDGEKAEPLDEDALDDGQPAQGDDGQPDQGEDGQPAQDVDGQPAQGEAPVDAGDAAEPPPPTN